MTLKNSSSVSNRRKTAWAGETGTQLMLFRQRLWPAALTVLTYFLVDVVVYYFMMAAQNRSVYLSSQEKLASMTNTMTSYMNFQSGVYFFAVLLAIILAIQGFAWLDDKRQLDFYESQPMTRRSRFFSIVLNSHLIFVISYVTMQLLAMALSAYFGIMTASAARMFAVTTFKTILLFFASYSLAALAAMLTGNVLIAVCAAGTLFLYETIMRMILNIYASTFWKTAADLPSIKPVLSPMQWQLSKHPGSYSALLLLGVFYLALAYITYLKRKHEDAGSAVLFGPVRIIVKTAVTFASALLTGAALSSLDENVEPVLGLLVGAVVCGCIMQIIYEYDFKALFHEFWSVILAFLLAVAVFAGFRFDVIRYDSWIPAPQEVESAYVADISYYTDRFTEDGRRFSEPHEFAKTYMHLTDIDAVNRLLALGQEEARKERMNASSNKTISLRIGYRMKNGTIRERIIHVPEKKGLRAVNQVTDSDEYREGSFQIYHDQFLQAKLNKVTISYENGASEDTLLSASGEELYDSLNAAYLKDLNQFSYAYVAEHPMVGVITVIQDNAYDGAVIHYPVYEGYSATIDALKEAGIYVEPADQTKDTVSLNGPFDMWYGNG
jgi:ABC-2 type transport system permease protein